MLNLFTYVQYILNLSMFYKQAKNKPYTDTRRLKVGKKVKLQTERQQNQGPERQNQGPESLNLV